ncbi:MotA/TolQ/ExbB proton channel family protein [Neptunomonas sp.]|uniref:MotA/TolQ/ExbB proton channel family protein n=1 Tax=Neptunomonas sp. TaxID=1971898 RepID=UPI00356803D8
MSVEAELIIPAELGSSEVSDKGVSIAPLAKEAASGSLDQGDAMASLAQEAPSVVERVQDFLIVGGPVVWILLGFSIIALSIVLVKLWQFALLRPESIRDVTQALALWREGEHGQAKLALKRKRPVSELVSIAMRGVLNVRQDMDLLKDELERVAALRLNQLRALLRPLEVIATLSPLLGLLGTVLGMITAFQRMEAAGNQVDPSVLSGGIWQALLTTAVGLAVAIPVVVVHSWLERKVERVAALMSDSVTQVFTGLQAPVAGRSEHEELKRAA